MEQNTSTGSTEKRTRAGKAGEQSAGKSSAKSSQIASRDIDLSTRLRILQQSIHDYQEAGGVVIVPDVGSVGTAFVLEGVLMDRVGNLYFESANTKDGE